MEAQATKHLNLIDAIVLVAATAAGLALGRDITSDNTSLVGFSGEAVATHLLTVAWTWTLAILALNLTRYFTNRRELACRPGFTAVVAVVVERVYGAIHNAIGFFDLPSDSPMERLLILLAMNAMSVVMGGSPGGAVAAVWTVTALAGCWRPEKSWIDRTGRALGLFWLVATVAYWLIVSVFPTPVKSISVPISGA